MDATKDLFKDKPLKFYIKHLEETAKSDKNETETSQVINDIIIYLIRSNRLFDISSLYNSLKSAAANKREIGLFYEPAKEILKRNIENLFTKSITYNNIELRTMFSDILGNDSALMIKLISFIFRRYDLFEMQFSENINKQLIHLADEDLGSFIEHAEPKFLAFYLATLPKLGFVPKQHIEDLTRIIILSTQYTNKILTAMNTHPTADILLIFLLSQHENDRKKALEILYKKLESNPKGELAKSFAEKSTYFIKTAVTSGLFYEFHNIPNEQKNLFGKITRYSNITVIKEVVLPLLRTPNPDKRTIESQLSFIPALEPFLTRYPDLIPELTIITRDKELKLEKLVSDELKQLVSKSK